MSQCSGLICIQAHREDHFHALYAQLSAISLLLNVLEILYLGIRKIRRAFYEKSDSEGIDDERAPRFHLRKYSVPQQYMICSPLSERLSLLQANNQQHVI